MKRRSFIKESGITAFGAGLPLSGAFAQNRYAKYAGQTVTVNVPAHPHYDVMAKILPQFTKETGIKVELDKVAIGRMKDKHLLEMAKPQGDYDLACYIVMWKSEYVSKNLIQPLDPFLGNRAWPTRITTSRTSSRSILRTWAWSVARRVISQDRVQNFMGYRTAQRLRCWPIVAISSTSTA